MTTADASRHALVERCLPGPAWRYYASLVWFGTMPAAIETEIRLPAPVLQALVLADHVYQDAATGKKIIAGTFNRLWAEQFPSVFGGITWGYVSLTNIHGNTNVELRYVDLQTNAVLMQTQKIRVASEDPLASAELMIQVPPLPMPHEGVFAFELHAEGVLLGSVRITVAKRQEG